MFNFFFITNQLLFFKNLFSTLQCKFGLYQKIEMLVLNQEASQIQPPRNLIRFSFSLQNLQIIKLPIILRIISS